MLDPPRFNMLLARAFGVVVIDEDVHVFRRGEVTDNLGIHPRDGLEFAGPVFGVVWPGDPGGGVRSPLGGHAEGGRLRGGTHPD